MSAVEERTMEELRTQVGELAQHYLGMSAGVFLTTDPHELLDTPAVRYMLVLASALMDRETGADPLETACVT